MDDSGEFEIFFFSFLGRFLSIDIVINKQVADAAGTMIVAVVRMPQWKPGRISSSQHHDLLFGARFGGGW